MEFKSKIKPFVKWAGGKKQLLPFLNIFMNIKYETYFEPFLGGGSVFLNLLPKKAVLSDINEELINAWKTLQKESDAVISLLKQYIKELNLLGEVFYYQVRNQDIHSLDNIQQTARFIFLNKTCFNGLYRVNSKNKFNTPFNGKTNISLDNLINKTNLKNIILFLKNNQIKILKQDYKKIFSQTKKNDLIFCDPPYDSDTKTFNGYNSKVFDKLDQEELSQYLKEAHLRGVKWILTNHDTSLINYLYKSFYFLKLPVDRFINSNCHNRKNNTYETIITNYELSDYQKKKIDNLLFFKELKNTSYVLKNYVSWDKATNFINDNREIIQTFNNLSSSTEKEFFDKLEFYYKRNTSIFKFLPILIANKNFFQEKKFIYLNNQNKEIVFDYKNKNIVFEFIKESNILSKFFLDSLNNQNIESYLLGILIGLETNSRKNKSGLFLTKLIEDILKNNKIKFKKEINLKNILKEAELIENKRIDFVFNQNKITYLLECSFFNVSGSKINSELNRMLEFDRIINKFKKYKLIYVMDGPGLKKTNILVNRILNETNNFFNIHRFQNFLKK
ncbi:Dam family site-specific DNA-(adenine-N6)-methyltransferase [Texas Phoenix palm phytoplasma]|uniref:Site-specific DNA-methyltransferase (adenine-specific) n=1 Tax=Texas Phoenix palm phytoplasma TaxID=176709 RepID=A0ABS5BIE6_9MOLU|nr:DpnII family type II restriction endonuclease [Texas Phoenix palm phytoplasma]MBP3059364.1 Dam family site-specific DNA-(adenine-N6)-methyltransferase [Texas Phoenix palm phytoplasma]